MRLILLTFFFGLATTAISATASAGLDRESLKIARQVKVYIANEHRKRKSDPSGDFEKLHKLCGRSQTWTKGCRFWKAKGGKDDFMFQVRKTGKIYGVPSYLLR